MTTAALRDPGGSELRVRVLGRLEVEGVVDGRLGSRKARTVLKLLVLTHGHAVSVDRLADALWRDELPAKPNDQVAVLVSRLRAVLGGDRIVFGDGGYRLELSWLDVEELSVLTESAVVSSRAGDHREALDQAMQALSIARGPLLPGDLDASWTEGPRAAAERAVARARRVAAAAALALGQVDAAAEIAAQALDVDLYDEVALRLLMQAELRRGRTGAGLAAYARVRKHLAEELGADPSRETEAVHGELLREDRGPAIRIPDRVATLTSPPTTTLLGRQGEIARLRGELARASLGHGRLVLVEGEAGIGKSSLLGVFGEQARADGALWLSAACEPFFGGLPMQSIVDALSAYTKTLSAAESADLLAGERAVLGRLIIDESAPVTPGPIWLDVDAGMQRMLGAFDAVFARLTATRRVVLAVDDVHLAGASTSELLMYLARRRPSMLVIVARRQGEGPIVSAGVTVALGPLAVEDAVRLVGPERGPALHERTGGNPLFLTQLAAVAADEPVPTSLVETVAGLASGLGEAGTTVISAAVLGATIDVDLLVAVLQIPPFKLVEHLDLACRVGLLDEVERGYAFRHELVREALADSSRSARSALLHREAARSLCERRSADPLAVARHAVLGGDRELAATALEKAAALASERFDRAVTEEFLDQSIRLSDTGPRRLARARVRTMRGNYPAALNDVEVALSEGVGAAALEAGAWAAYFARRPEARSYADDGAALAGDSAVRASCLAVAGRVRHADGDLVGAEPLLREAAALAEGPARAAPRVWLGVLRSHQGRPAEALELLRGITRVESGSDRTSELLHALLFTAHACSLSGRPLEGLEALQRYDVELERREVPRFAGRASNFRGWILRALGQWERADEANIRAKDELGHVDFPETVIASHLDLASSALLRADAGSAEAALLGASQNFTDGLTFGWRLQLRLRLERARLALLVGNAHEAAAGASEVADVAERLGVARYATVARLVVARSRRRAGEPFDLDSVAYDIGLLDADVGIDAWWITAEVARDFGVPAWRERALSRVASLARAAGTEDVGLAGAVALLLP